MVSWLTEVFGANSGFMPHGACFLWLPSILWLHVLSDALIALSYFSIPIALNYFIKARKDTIFPRILILFGAFILLCGLTHVMGIWTIWKPNYWFHGFVKLATAFVSVVTAATLWRLMPQLVNMPSPSAYQAKEDFISAIFNATPDAMLITDSKGNITMANDQASVLFGIRGEDLLALELDAVLSKKSDLPMGHHFPDPCKQNDRRKRLTDDSLIFIASRQDKGEIEVEVSFNTFKTAQGTYIAFAMRDVTEQRQAEAALIESEERFYQLANDAETMIWISDNEGNFTFLNQYWRHFTGIDADQLPFSEWLELIHPNDKKVAFIGHHKHPAEGVSITSEYRIRGVNGDWFWIFDKGRGNYQHGDCLGYIGSAIDITAHKKAEADLLIAAAAFEAQEPLIITDADALIQRANKAFMGITGFKKQEIIGKKMHFLKSGMHDKNFYDEMWQTINDAGFWQGEIWDKRKNGEIFPVWLTVTAVKNEAGQVTHYVGNYIDITKRKLAEEEIKTLAFFDSLTQLPNRRMLQDRINHGILRAKREEQQLALLVLDLDRFKDVNDTLGHQTGDELLKQVAERIQTQLRAVDTVARLGGDEFVVLLENITKPEDAARVSERIIKRLSKPYRIEPNHEVWVGVSIGISLYPQHGENFESLMAHADAAMYKSKEQGGGSIVYFSEDFTRLARERINLEGRLRKAITLNELRVFFQPQIDIKTDRIIGAEALVRWQDPNEGLIPPGRFIPVAEETNLIVAIGEWVLNETCKQGRRWLDMGFPPITLAVNVSTQQFKRSDITKLANTTLSETGFPAGQLELEITESGLMNNQENAIAILNLLHNKGIKIAIDDFGTGYSSLAYLKRFPLDVLKIDKSFIDDIPHGKDDMEIAATIVAMAHNLGFKVIAEGVETKEQLEFLRLKGCDAYQGYYKCRPIPIDEFTKLLDQQNQSGA